MEYGYLFNSDGNESEVGKLVLCEAKDNNSTRLFIRSFTITDDLLKQGWWNIFTVAKSPFKKGFHFAKITGFKVDRNGYPNMIVEPAYFLGESINLDLDAWGCINYRQPGTMQYIFSSIYCNINMACSKCFNQVHRENVLDHFGEVAEACDLSVEEYLFNMICVKTNITIDEIQSIMEEPTALEKVYIHYMDMLNTKNPEFCSKYPRFAAGFEQFDGGIQRYVESLMDPYYKVFGYTARIEAAEKCEKILTWRIEEKERKKEERKQKRMQSKKSIK